MVTNPAVIRVIIDYVIIALKGTGKIVLGDAPMQGCNLQEVFCIAGYNELFKFYEDKGVEIKIADLQKYSVSALHKGVMSRPQETINSWGSKRRIRSEIYACRKGGISMR